MNRNRRNNKRRRPENEGPPPRATKWARGASGMAQPQMTQQQFFHNAPHFMLLPASEPYHYYQNFQPPLLAPPPPQRPPASQHMSRARPNTQPPPQLSAPPLRSKSANAHDRLKRLKESLSITGDTTGSGADSGLTGHSRYVGWKPVSASRSQEQLNVLQCNNGITTSTTTTRRKQLVALRRLKNDDGKAFTEAAPKTDRQNQECPGITTEKVKGNREIVGVVKELIKLRPSHQPSVQPTAIAIRNSDANNNNQSTPDKKSLKNRLTLAREGKSPMFRNKRLPSSPSNKSNNEPSLELVNTSNMNVYTKKSAEPPVEAMDLDTDENELINNIIELRGICSFEDSFELQEKYKSCYNETIRDQRDAIYIIVDTNIFLSHLDIIKKLVTNTKSTPPVVVFIPWMVIQELDHFKENGGTNKLDLSARKAIKFVNESLNKKLPNIKAQLVQDALSQRTFSKNPDDGILSCSIQMQGRNNDIILFTNDVNLRNKAMINGLCASSSRDIFDKLKKLQDKATGAPNKSTPVAKMVTKLGSFLSIYSSDELRQAYGVAFEGMPFSKTPWDCSYSLKMLEKYWQSVFSMVLPKQAINTVKRLQNYLNSSAESNATEIKQQMLSLCVFLKIGMPKSEKIINNIAADLDNY